MIRGIGSDSSLAQTALEAALRAQKEAQARLATGTSGSASAAGAADFTGSLAETLKDGVRAVNAAVGDSEKLPVEMIRGQIGDFHEVAARLKESELTFKFALEVRNKLIDAYRETMRMSV